MIVSIGEAYIKDNAVAGAAVETSLQITRMGASAMFAGSVSSDAQGIRILEYLIDNCIFFDPVFCNDGKPTWIDGEGGTDLGQSCIFSIDAKRLANTMGMNTDVRVVLPNSIAFTSRAVRDAVWNVLKDRTDIAICLDLTVCNQDEQVCIQWAQRSEIVIAYENTAEKLKPYCKNVLIAAKPGFSSTAQICTAADEASGTISQAVQDLLKNGLNDCSILTCLP